MKTIIIKIIVICALMVINAFSTVQATDTHDYCKDMANYAEAVMMARQNGASAIELYEDVNNSTDNVDDRDVGKRTGKIMISIINMAWDEPVFTTYERNQEAVKELQSYVFIHCMRLLE